MGFFFVVLEKALVEQLKCCLCLFLFIPTMVKLLFGQWVNFQRKSGLADTLSESAMLRKIAQTDRASHILQLPGKICEVFDRLRIAHGIDIDRFLYRDASHWM